jgi:indolepyruvate ferredoxin oxidoreductase
MMREAHVALGRRDVGLGRIGSGRDPSCDADRRLRVNAPSDPVRGALRDEALRTVSLDDKYELGRGRAFMSGTHALVRLLMLQRERDRRAGLNTAGFVSGYRGSPLGALDHALWQARDPLARHQVVFQPGVNEDLAATAVWGTQQVALSAQARVAGVFAMWYAKGPGVDRSIDVLKHANAAGTARHGGVLVIAGDDHGAKSSTLPHQSDHVFKASGIPLFYPATVQEYLDLGLHGWAMSRWSGLWVAMKTVTEVVESSASVDIDPERVQLILPEDFPYPHEDPYGLNIRWPDTPLAQEARLCQHKWYAALAYVRANRLNYTVWDSQHAWFGIVTAGKAYLDTMQALEDLGLNQAACARLGIRVFKCGVVWPLEASTIREFAMGLDEILVVEEKRQLLEYALKEELYHWRDDVRPQVYGKFDEKDGRGGEWAMPQGRWLLPALGELSPALIAKAIAARLLNPGQYAPKLGGGLPAELRAGIEQRLAIIEAKERLLAEPHVTVHRVPTFCAGCPHNLSTHVPEGSRAVGGIGCHYMATFMPERRTETFAQMGGEGVPWIGQAPFSAETHVFANLGDGTYFHSGSMAVRAAVAAKVNITYKILYNDAVAMTGGQPVDGSLSVTKVVAQMQAEGVAQIVVVAEQPERYRAGLHSIWGPEIQVHERQHLDRVQQQLRAVPGCTVLIYDQTCASEKRRRRKKIVAGQPAYPDPARRTVINPAVCEGCGDCSVQSSCVAVEPLETDWGRKRRINQSACNKDEACIQGFCPSFVTLAGARPRRGRSHGSETATWPECPEPDRVRLDSAGHCRYGVLVTGVGGTGVVTIGQLLGMAGHLEGLGISVLDMAGLAQKGGAVFSHVQMAAAPDRLYATRIATGEADLIIGADLVVSAGNDALSKMRPGLTRAVINSDVTPTADFLRDADWQAPTEALQRNVRAAAGAREIDFVAATRLAQALLGDALFTNPLLLGYAWQKGWLPVSRQALERAIELNGKAVAANLAGFLWGRRLAQDPEAVRRFAGLEPPVSEHPAPPAHDVQSLADLIERRAQSLTAYQNAAWAARFRAQVERVRLSELERCGTEHAWALTEAVARGLSKLMMYKDEYEVARLHSAPEFRAALAEEFEGPWQMRFHLAPPLLSRKDPNTGVPVKREWGPWMLPVMRGLAHLRGLRGTRWDLFGYTAERRLERGLIRDYDALIDELVAGLTASNYGLAVKLARLPEGIRGYGHVKARHLEEVRALWVTLLAQWRGHQVGRARRVIPIHEASDERAST